MTRFAVHVACADAQSIDTFQLDTGAGALTSGPSLALESKVQCLAMHPEGSVLYAALATSPPTVRSLTIGGQDGALTPGPDADLPAGMAYLSVSPAGNALLGASYNDHLVSVMNLDADGGILPDTTSTEAPGEHAHAVVISPDGRFAYATALGDDLIVWWTLDPVTSALTNRGQIATPTGSGPRHLRFSPAGDTLYALHEMSGEIAAYARDAGNGALIEQQRISSVSPELNLVPGRVRDGSGPEPAANAIWCAELQVSPDGRFLYSTERSSSTIAVVAVGADGTLALVDTVPTQAQPRGMNIDPTGGFLLACGEASGGLTLYAIDPENGGLRERESLDCSAGPRWIEFSPLT
ncbi:beta-propeller fold lactonase family protein [Arthrobacter sp. CAN_C5]|uniref:lactonase family protein n=1 Tax=Arthrobacter sp. CAN_C5 TaxID=2760706 RepID=UPI001AE9BEF9|nr:beta-propeller fold lactonase family protein [Arthrobacter sp. CAN_C5]MBP2214907.1 6-phosphogluconolactonase [Arthrobacter sp. CAN_C5]